MKVVDKIIVKDIENKRLRSTQEGDVLEFDHLTILMGINGAGKSSIIKRLELLIEATSLGDRNRYSKYKPLVDEMDIVESKDENTKVFIYTNSLDNDSTNINNRIAEIGQHGRSMFSDREYFAKTFEVGDKSEGQSIRISAMDFLFKVKQTLTDNKDMKGLILLDEIDSGLSVNNCNLIMHVINLWRKPIGLPMG